MRRKLLWTCLFGTVVVITGCGGGGGGGGGGGPYNSSNPYLRTEVPYATPVRVGNVDPLVNNNSTYAVVDTFTATISGSGQDVIVAGRATAGPDTSSSQIGMFSWQNGTLVDKTAQWFPNNINVITGTEPSVKFADFWNRGRTDMFVAPSTDGNITTGPSYVYTNNGTSFSRQAIGNSGIWAHDSAIADFNGDGFKDIFILDYNATNTTLALNDRVSSFTTYIPTQGGSARLAGSSVAAADFLGNGSTSLIVTDTSTDHATATKLYSWSIDSNDRLGFTELSTLPTPRFMLPKWAALGINSSHAIRTVAHDFNSDNAMDAIIFSIPGQTTTKDYSEIQFLKNNGSGSFTDVTDNTLIGYNTNTRATYQPKFIDINGDGLIDILVSGWDNSGVSNQFLLKSSDGKYVATHANLLTDFLQQSKNLTPGSTTNYNDSTVNVVQAPDGKLYLLTSVSFVNGSDRQVAIYISLLGSQSTTTAQTAVNLMLQKWPYMTATQANDALARTVATYINGIGIIDEDSIFKPIGSLNLPTTGGYKAINGFIAGLNLGDGSVVAMDQVGRSYNLNLTPMSVNRLNAFGYNTEHNDQYELTSHAEYLVNGAVTTVNGLRIGNDWSGRDNTGMGQNKPKQYTVGVPRWYSKGNWSLGTQYTYLNSNPWIAFGGAWGEITGSGIMDNVITYRRGGFSAQASAMHVTTNIQPGLITRVNNMWGTWAESGYRFGDARRAGDMGIYAGIKPVVLSGSVEASLPTAVDMSGNVVYTNKTLQVQNQTTGYVRALYTNQLTKQTQLRLSAVGTTAGQYRAMTELKFWID
jgi:hypothetical protein